MENKTKGEKQQLKKIGDLSLANLKGKRLIITYVLNNGSPYTIYDQYLEKINNGNIYIYRRNGQGKTTTYSSELPISKIYTIYVKGHLFDTSSLVYANLEHHKRRGEEIKVLTHHNNALAIMSVVVSFALFVAVLYTFASGLRLLMTYLNPFFAVFILVLSLLGLILVYLFLPNVVTLASSKIINEYDNDANSINELIAKSVLEGLGQKEGGI